MASKWWRRSVLARWPRQTAWLLLAVGVTIAIGSSHHAQAITQIPDPDPKPGSYGLSASKPQPPPKQGARISSPTSGTVFTESPITVEGICPTGLLVEILNNNVMVGAVMCENGSFSIQVSLFSGENELSALVYDDNDQVGPESNKVTVTYNNTNLSQFGEMITLTSTYSRRAQSINRVLAWPLQLSGGTGPYALTIDWGDGTASDLRSLASAGTFDIDHVYKRAGIYTVNIKVVDSNGVSAFLQLVAVANGEAVAAGTGEDLNPCRCNDGWRVLWIPVVIVCLMLPLAFWLGRRSQLVSLRAKLDKERDSYKNESS